MVLREASNSAFRCIRSGVSARSRADITLKLNDSSTNADGDGLRPVVRVKFLQDVLEMCFHRFFRDKELFGYVPVSVSASQLAENVYFARSKMFVAVVFG